ncbi:hypothetical protein A2U01_0031414, partial [Trifolium medium]|nr:hypothetical protein [Trifolium medium]
AFNYFKIKDNVKINVDGNFSSKSSMGSGGIIRSSNGSWESDFPCFEGSDVVLLAEEHFFSIPIAH